jgi:hypothetical protein
MSPVGNAQSQRLAIPQVPGPTLHDIEFARASQRVYQLFHNPSAASQRRQSRLHENLLRKNPFSRLVVTVYPPEDWTPERRKQFGVETAQRYCASLGPKLQAQIWSVRVFLDDSRNFVADCEIKPAGNGK